MTVMSDVKDTTHLARNAMEELGWLSNTHITRLESH